MRLIKIWVLIGFVMMGLISCGDEPIEQTNTNTNTNTTINKIMALGASRVEGNRVGARIILSANKIKSPIIFN